MSLVSKLAPALFVSALMIVPASAAPVGPNALSVDSSVIQVKKDGDGHHGGGKHHGGGGGKHHGGKHHGGGGKGHGGHHGGGNWHRGHGHGHGHGRWVAGHRYHAAPGGWRRYGARPWDWQTRGCVLVGPVWFCP